MHKPGLARNIERLARRSGIATRHSVIPDYAVEPEGFTLYPKNWRLDPFPTTRERLDIYETTAVALAETAAREALDEARVTPRDVTHLVLSTCTGFFSPGPDIGLVQRLGLAPTVNRTVIGFMGCYAGFNGIRTAHDIVRADPSAVVLQVCVELCTLHLQRDDRLQTMVSNLLFADGAAAAVYARTPNRGRAEVRGTLSQVASDSLDQMSWRIGNHGFVMQLAPTVPEHLQQALPSFIEQLCRKMDVSQSEVRSWAVHPGGRRVLEVVGEGVGSDLAESFHVLEHFGNMSSATVLFVLDRVLREGGGFVGALGFGPGLTMEAALFHCSS